MPADRDGETVCTITLWESAEEMAASKALASGVAEAAAKEYDLNQPRRDPVLKAPRLVA